MTNNSGMSSILSPIGLFLLNEMGYGRLEDITVEDVPKNKFKEHMQGTIFETFNMQIHECRFPHVPKIRTRAECKTESIETGIIFHSDGNDAIILDKNIADETFSHFLYTAQYFSGMSKEIITREFEHFATTYFQGAEVIHSGKPHYPAVDLLHEDVKMRIECPNLKNSSRRFKAAFKASEEDVQVINKLVSTYGRVRKAVVLKEYYGSIKDYKPIPSIADLFEKGDNVQGINFGKYLQQQDAIYPCKEAKATYQRGTVLNLKGSRAMVLSCEKTSEGPVHTLLCGNGDRIKF